MTDAPLSPDAYRAAVAREGGRLLSVAALDLDAVVPRCPGWTTRDLLDHVAGVLRFVAGIVVSREAPVGRPEPRPADADPVAFAERALRDLQAGLAPLEPDDPVWNWSVGTPDTGAFWLRRMAQELLVHRLDAERAVGDPTPIDAALAADGVRELCEVFVPRVQGRAPFVRFVGSVRLEATDVPVTCVLTTTAATTALASDGPADASARGRAEDLLLALWGRQDWDVLELDGAVELFAAYAEEVRA